METDFPGTVAASVPKEWQSSLGGSCREAYKYTFNPLLIMTEYWPSYRTGCTEYKYTRWENKTAGSVGAINYMWSSWGIGTKSDMPACAHQIIAKIRCLWRGGYSTTWRCRFSDRESVTNIVIMNMSIRCQLVVESGLGMFCMFGRTEPHKKGAPQARECLAAARHSLSWGLCKP